MTPFDYVRPTTLVEAIEALRELEDARPIAGGMTLIPTLKQGLAAVGTLVDLAHIDEFYGVRRQEQAIEIGAMTRHYDVAHSMIIRDALPGLATLANGIGDLQVRNRGTIGGSVANNDPAADYPAALVALAATIVTDRREISADDFFVGMFETALEPDEVITAIRFPTDRRSAYAKFNNPVSGYAIAGVFVADGDPSGPRVAVVGAGSVVFRATAIETGLAAGGGAHEARSIKWPADGLITDLHAPAAYRAQLVSVLAARAVEKMI